MIEKSENFTGIFRNMNNHESVVKIAFDIESKYEFIYNFFSEPKFNFADNNIETILILCEEIDQKLKQLYPKNYSKGWKKLRQKALLRKMDKNCFFQMDIEYLIVSVKSCIACEQTPFPHCYESENTCLFGKDFGICIDKRSNAVFQQLLRALEQLRINMINESLYISNYFLIST